MSETPVIQIDHLVVEYGAGKKKVRAVDDISFRVEQGEVVGFIGANGAGKSTTIKTIMGFMFPASGEVSVFGAPAGSIESRSRIGYLPEVALYYPFMKVRELLHLYGGLNGMDRRTLNERIPQILRQVGLLDKEGVLLKQFSKGMQQRLGIAQALISEPDALIFDELSSGLDPLGRNDLRNVLQDLKKKGRTIFFSSHELSEVENLCDRVIMIHKGRVIKQAPVNEVLQPLNQFEIHFSFRDKAMPETIRAKRPAEVDGHYRLNLYDADEYASLLKTVIDHGGTIARTHSRTISLEDFFIDLVRNIEQKA